MVLEDKSYVPTLAVRPSEMNGLEFSLGAAKDRMTPCFLLAPWANSSTLERTITRIERAFPNRSYFLDIDWYYHPTNSESGPQQELRQLKDPKNCFENWTSFVKSHKNVSPCIQTQGQTEAEILHQIKTFQQLNRTYCLRILKDRPPENTPEIVSALASRGTADFVIILEGGWTNDTLSQAAWFQGFISENLQPIDASVPIVLSCTSMPKMFSSISSAELSSVPFNNRILIDQVSKSTNRARIIYGDWGSTRPREPSGFANRPLDRIDYPTERSWIIARNKEDEWDFRDAALAVVNGDDWDGKLGIWGEEMIQQTTINEELGIDTPQKNVSARVNIHLHRQAFFGQPTIDPISFDEDWED